LPVAREVAAPLLVEDGASILAGLGSTVAGGVAVAGAAGYLAGQAIGSLFTQTNFNQVVQALMPGSYQGKIALSARSSFKGLRDKFQKRGAVYIIENYGSVVDPDLVYIGHSTFNIGCAINAIGIALLRKLFRVGIKLDPQTQYEELALISVTPDSGPQGFEIIYETRDSDGTQNKVTHTIPNDASLDTLLNQNQNGFSLYNNIEESMTEQNPQVLQKVYLYQKNNSNGESRLQYQMDMLKEVLTIAMSSHMIIQNRTKAAADGSSSTTQIDVQPLKGPVYEFSVGVPKLKAETPIGLASMESGGILLVRAGQFPGTDNTAYREPPVRKAFQNVVKSGYARLNPGALKSMAIGADCRGYYQNVLFKLRYNSDTTQIKRCYGKSQMACFEEELNSEVLIILLCNMSVSILLVLILGLLIVLICSLVMLLLI